MAHTVESRVSNPANDLRDALEDAERLAVQLNGQNVESFLVLLDRIDHMLEQFTDVAIDLRPERARWDSLLARLDSRAGDVVQAANVAGGLGRLRAQHPPAESFWWHLDATVAQRRRKTVTRVVTTLVAILAAGALLLWGVNTLFPPNPDAVAMVETTQNIDRLIAEQRWEDALAVVQEARQRLPNEPELAVWEVVLYEQMGMPDQAQAALADAQRMLAGNPAQVWLQLGNNRLMVGDLDGAEAAAVTAEGLAPENAMVYFLQGGVAEARGDVPRAIELFDKTFQVAGEDNAQLAVIARVRMGQLLQRPDAFLSPVATPTPTP
jgi:tetratricopeptide (TPR) repeat protein